MPYTSDKRLWLTKDDQVVEEGDPKAATLLVGEGGTLDDETAARYNLSNDGAKQSKRVTENKAVTREAADTKADVSNQPKSGIIVDKEPKAKDK